MSDMQPENIKSFQNAHSPFTGEEIESQPGIQHTLEAGPREAGENRYWLSLDQWSNDPEFQKMAEKEFLSSPLAENNSEDGWARREFLKLMGASLALASAGCIRRPVQKIVPYNKQPEEVTHAVANYYTTSYFDGSETQGLLIRTKDGRPLKVEGNPAHPLSGGGTSVRSQAHLLSLYDPERLKGPVRNLQNKAKTNRDTITAKWEEADDAIVKQLSKGKVVVLSGAVASPSTRQLMADFNQAFGAKHIVWEALNDESVRQGQDASYGEDLVPFHRFDKAKVIVSVDADFLGTWVAPTTYTKQFAKARKDIEKMNRLVVFDSAYSLTGANADIRVRIKPSQQVDVVMALAHEVIVKKGAGRYAGNSQVKAALEPFAGVASTLTMEPALFSQIAQDLIDNRGDSLVVAGGLAAGTTDAKALQIAVNFLNSALDNDGSTVLANGGWTALKASFEAVLGLVEDMKKGDVNTLIIHRTNPAYNLPESLGFKEAMKNVGMVIYTGDRVDETGKQADYVLPDNHVMEGWGDAEFTRGLMSLQQPTLRPMYDTRSFQLSLMTWAYMAKRGPARIQNFETFYDYLRDYWKNEVYPKYGRGIGFENFWNEVLQKGFVGEVPNSTSARSFRLEALNSVKKKAPAQGFEMVLYPTVQLGDGTLANIAWLQELPDPVTKICWDNYVCVSLATAEKLGAREGHIMKIKTTAGEYSLPVHIHPGLHDDVLAVPVGYGRTDAGKVANGVGFNSFQMANVAAGLLITSGISAEITNTKKKYELANPQGHHSLGDSKTAGRKIVVEATLAEYLKDKAANNHKHKIWNIWSGHAYNGNKWGMAIDLNSCTGCNACVVACQSENNVTVVGKKYVMEGREMHWIRIDRYFVGDPANAEVVFQPVMCQHCDNAPCETVCPVLATVHNSEGLNDMVYNRCVGTRYCANNCPYKVRRFNWFNYAKLIEKPMHLALNPDVTVRTRGVMEKCTFCVHRIKEKKNEVKLKGGTLKDGDVKTACQTSCPTDAIIFGDLNDPESRVSKHFKEDPRNYALLEEFHAAPSVRYMTKIRNNHQETRFKDAHGKKGGHA
ncbi:MAG: TAT-variant-translocated molybdopterin oxidoreductase [Proteobacteria bacterium]|jgi:molybdopterin-containing oxidoreductase family iron-sulfur binding subunit|nr:TAT-variant-translocated molybdopterin oxidoreductase [Pseudomonadota bacterium]